MNNRIDRMKNQVVDNSGKSVYSVLELMIREYGYVAVLEAAAEINAATQAESNEAISRLGQFRNDPRKAEGI